MRISIADVGKKYNRNWIFRKVTMDLLPGEKLAITGRNGAGKSTLLKIIGGYIAPTEGKVIRSKTNDDFQVSFSFASPYLNLIEEFTLSEHLDFHSRFKEPIIPFGEMIARCGLQGANDKFISEFSSGMKQRLRLALAFFFKSEVILLDEPGSNLDVEGMQMYLDLIGNFSLERSVIIASNQKAEYQMCNKILAIEKFQFNL